MVDCPEQEESERRALEVVATDWTTATELNKNATAAVNPAKNRRRGSISITRFGQLADESSKLSQGPPPTLSATASRTTFYQAQPTNDSIKSFASGASAYVNGEGVHMEDDHVTQMLHIAGRKTISKAVGGFLPRRLSRAHSTSVFVGEANMIIGVSVEESTVESAEGAEASQTIIHAGALRNQPSRVTMAGSSPARNSWVAKAKGFTQRFRRKSKASGPITSPL
ncbi:hypothetical protein DXG03_006227 [Asterophora parasitica]|uniref:Uncharacterized protein n=1 Tax=Asterophora parasitica TaxID=117018 RepID=A0A9P7KCB1_9AGAR|nr:hypothetical protein DXG03_006227 [Asterophora parasitica]